ncbi:MAG: hypothetical protein OXG17_05960 [Chloroflexi bacterium]|nr:hypothetical protein [Chloroflexota bacterium]
MTLDPTVLPGLVLFALEMLALAAVGFVVARVALRQTDDGMALAQGMVIGPALWGLTVSLVLHVVPGMAGAFVGWCVVLLAGVVLAWRERYGLSVRPRIVAGLAAAGLAIYWVALAGRQLLSIPDAALHMSLAATLRGGQFPPTLAWSPGEVIWYHYGADLLIGLLAPPAGPDVAFVTELLGAYAWTSLALVVGTALLRYGGIPGLVFSPLLLTAGAWTLVWQVDAPGVLRIPIPSGIPAAGIRASLGSIYWPTSEWPWELPLQASPPSIWKPPFVLAYALSLVILERATSSLTGAGWNRWVLAPLIGFLGLLATEVALVVLAVWISIEVARVYRTRSSGSTVSTIFSSVGVIIPAGILLAGGGSALTGLMFGASAGTTIGWHADAWSRTPIGTLHQLPGGVAVLGVGVIPTAIGAVILSRRNSLVVALAIASGIFLLAALTLQLSPVRDVTRFDGHARNFALLALMIGLAGRMIELQPRWRFAVGSLVLLLVTIPTATPSVQALGRALSEGISLSNHKLPPSQQPSSEHSLSPVGRHAEAYRRGALKSPEPPHALLGRFRARQDLPEAIVDYVRNRTPVDSVVLSPHPHDMTAAAGRANASGFPGYRHLSPRTGPDYLDAVRYLEPAALRRLGIEYVHATDAWAASLPQRARNWLNDARMFEVLISTDSDSLYAVRAAFLRLETNPEPMSFQALREAIPASAAVALVGLPSVDAIRVATALPDVRVLAEINADQIHLLSQIDTESLADNIPDVAIIPLSATPFLHASTQRLPSSWQDPVMIWQSYELTAWATRSAVASAITPADIRHPESNFEIRLSNARMRDSSIIFSAQIIDRTLDAWTGQDWLVIPVEDSAWAIPTDVDDGQYTPSGAVQWYSGWIVPGSVPEQATLELNVGDVQLVIRGNDSAIRTFQSSGTRLTPGVWAFVLRLRNDSYDTALIPVMTIVMTDSGELSYQMYEGTLGVRLTR